VEQEIFTKEDIKTLESCNKTVSSAKREYEILLKGVQFVNIQNSATIENGGIQKFSDQEFENYMKKGKHEIKQNHVIKFNPASGAASRMFKQLHFYHQEKDRFSLEDIKKIDLEVYNFVTHFHSNISKFAFYDELIELFKKKGLTRYDDISQIISFILTEDGLDYSNKPKAFIKFHKYSEEDIRDAFEEQIVEGIACGITKYHFTFSPEHEKIAIERIKEVKKKYNKYQIEINYSFQDPATNTIALDVKTKLPSRDKNGKLILRMGGHGSLINNVNNLKEEIAILKNIDNIPKEDMQDLVCENILANIGYTKLLHEKISNVINLILNKKISIKDTTEFLEKDLCIKVPNTFFKLNEDEQYKILFSKINRPIKVCQMVSNDGEPGGGPVFVMSKDGFSYLRIAEQAEAENGKNNQHMKGGTHFNPVNLTMYLKDYKGEFFDLNNYINWDSCFISAKSHEGKDILALELPGLWNGATEDFITIFVDAPIETFQPVKTVNDLLRDGHLVKK
jgi:hypothetical protein